MKLIEKNKQAPGSGFVSSKAAFGEPQPRHTAKRDKSKVAAPRCGETPENVISALPEDLISALPEPMLEALDELFEDAAVLTGLLHDPRRERMAQCFDALRAGSQITRALMEHAAG